MFKEKSRNKNFIWIWKKRKYVMFRHQFILFLTFLMVILFVGCRDEKAEMKKDRDEKVQQLDILYREYLTGDIDQARQSIFKSIDILEKATSVYNAGRAHGLCWCYARLYCIEKYAGNNDAAYVAFVKAKYWRTQEIELGQKYSRLSFKESVQIIRGFTPEGCEELMRKWDNHFTDGKGPVYARIKKQPATTMPESKK